MRCERCGSEAPYFNEYYSPDENKHYTVWLCSHCQKGLREKILGFVREVS